MQCKGLCARAASAAVLLVLVTAGGAAAAPEAWTPIGPAGGMITGLAFDGSAANIAYATSAGGGGFFRSLDGGISWAAANAGLTDGHLLKLVVAGSSIFVGGEVGVSRSTNRGRSFARLPGAPILVTALAAGAGARPAIYAAGLYDGAWRSTDDGATWQEMNEGLVKDQPLQPGLITALLVDPRRPNLVWAGSSNNGVYRTLDGGAHWANTSQGLSCFVTSLVIDAGNTLYAGCYVEPLAAAPLPPALFVSNDLGLSWHAAVHGLDGRGVTALLADGSGTVWAGTQNAGVFRSADGGRHWQAAGSGTAGQPVGALTQSPHQGALLLAGGGFAFNDTIAAEGAGIFRTTSGGALWAPAAAGPDATSILALVADPTAPGLLTALDMGAGVFRSATGGAHWHPLSAGLPVGGLPDPSTAVTQLAGDPVQHGVLWAAGTVANRNALWRHDGGATPWQPVTALPTACGLPLAAGAGGQVLLGAFGTRGGSVCRSAGGADNGATWTEGAVGAIFVTAIAVAPSNPARVYATGILAPHAPTSPTFWRSDDGGITWTGVNSSVVAADPHALAIDPQDPDLVYLAVGGVQRSRDGGATWETLTTGDETGIWVSPESSTTLFAIRTFTSGSAVPRTSPAVEVSDDGGATWSPLDSGLPANIAVSNLAFDAGNPALVYAATAGGGIFSLLHTL